MTTGFGKKAFTTGQVAKIMGVAPRTVSKIFDAGLLKGYRIPGSQDRRIPREQLIRFLKDHGMPLGELEDDLTCKVLLVGFEKPDGDRLVALLSSTDEFRFERTLTIFEAGTLVKSFVPSVVVVDFWVGSMEAKRVAQSLRRDEAFAKTLIVGIVGEDVIDPEQLKEYGFSAIHQKPFDWALLAEGIRKHREDDR